MKKLKLFLKSLIGIPLGIFTLEIVNIIVSVKYGKYIRLDCFEGEINLDNILRSYFYNILTSYMLTVCILNSVYLVKSEIPIVEKQKQSNKLTIPLIIILHLILAIFFITNQDDPSIYGYLISLGWTVFAMFVIAIKDLIDRYTMKEINKKLKETISRK